MLLYRDEVTQSNVIKCLEEACLASQEKCEVQSVQFEDKLPTSYPEFCAKRN